MTDNNSVILEKRGQALWITINRPEKRNAINGDVIAGIARGYRTAHDDKNVRVIVLTGAGDKAFCAGADLQNTGGAFAADFAKPNVDYADLLRLSQNATKPAIARVGGVCMAGGMGLLCMTDMAIAADHVMFGLPEVKVGVFPMQVMSLLQSIAPRRLVNEWAITGEPFDARTAQAAGLLNYVVPQAELDAKLDWLIGRITDKSPTAIRRGKYAMRAIASMSFDESIAYTESQIALLAMTEDAKEGSQGVRRKAQTLMAGEVGCYGLAMHGEFLGDIFGVRRCVSKPPIAENTISHTRFVLIGSCWEGARGAAESANTGSAWSVHRHRPDAVG